MVWFTSPMPTLYLVPGGLNYVTATIAATTAYSTWSNNSTATASAYTPLSPLLTIRRGTATASNTTVWADNSNWYSNWVCTPDEWADYHASRAVAAPYICRVTERELAERDQELYTRAVAEHNQQEIDRLARQMAERARVMAERARVMAERIDAEKERERLRREEIEQRKIAQARANEFLLEYLSPEQRKAFQEHGWFIVEGGISKTKYRIRGKSAAGNIDVLNSDNTMAGHRLCGHAAHHIPLGDQLLAQKMMLQYSEDEFLRLANRHAV